MIDESVNLDFTRSRLVWSDRIQVGELELGAEEIILALADMLTEPRRLRLMQVVERRSRHLVTVLENIYDRGNISAVMRSSEAFGFLEVNILDSPGAKFKAANRVTRGADKWLDVKSFTSAVAVAEELKKQGYQLWATDLNCTTSIDDIDWSRPVAIVLGNEKDGVSKDMSDLVDGRFQIPMQGFSQSFNISVAAALIYYRAQLELRRSVPGSGVLDPVRQRLVLANYYLRCFDNPEALLRAKGHRPKLNL